MLGLHQDDWFITYFVHFLGPSSLLETFAIDRPLLGWVHFLTTNLVGESPLRWQVFGVFARWLSGLAMWWTLRALWPGWSLQVTAVVFLFALYPGFGQQYIAITYSSAFIVFALFLVSLGAMVWAFREGSWFWPKYLLSLGLCSFTLFTVEYFFGLEMLRPVLLWLILRERIADARKRIKHVGLYWTPYLLLMLVFIVYRLSTPTPRGQITLFDRLGGDPLVVALDLGKTVLQDVFEVTGLAWMKTLELTGLSSYGTITLLKYILIALGSALLSALYLFFMHTDRAIDPGAVTGARRRWAFESTILGLYALIVAGAPIWVTSLRIDLSYPLDRFTLPMMVGTSFVMVGLIELMTRTRMQSVLLVGVAVGLAAGLHFQTALSYRREWLLQKDFFWQLAWRAPGIQPGTVLLTSELPFVYNVDSLLTAPLNWIYSPSLPSRDLPYQLYNVESHLGLGLAGFEEGTPIYQTNRLTPFEGSTSQAIVVFYRPPACLKVIDPQVDRRFPDKPRYFRELLPLSKPDLIQPHADPGAHPPAHFFGAEPEHDWCYYFQKAELARQKGDWQEVADLGDQALEAGTKISYKKSIELVPFIQGYAYTGRWEDSQALTLQAYQSWENVGLSLCDLWEQIYQSASLDIGGQAAYQQVQRSVGCSTP